MHTQLKIALNISDSMYWHKTTYIVSHTDHQMFLDLRTPQTKPTGTFQGSWGENVKNIGKL